VVVVVALLAVAACTHGARADGTGAGAGMGRVDRANLPLLADVGGACQLLDYGTIRQTLGFDFDLGAAAEQGTTYTCAVQARRASLPDLVLAVTAATVDENVYKATVQPQGATPVAGVGKVAYSIAVPAHAKAGPGAEVGWLTGDSRLITLRVRLPVSAAPQVDLVPKLVELAKIVDQTSV
jgi:hypothetical protein